MSFIVGELTARIDGDSRPLNDSLNNARNLGNNFTSQFTSSLSVLGGQMTSLGATLTKSISLPIAAAGLAVFKLGKDYETELSKIVGLVGIARSQVNEWGAEILVLAPKLGRAPKELAEALYFVTSAGIAGAEAMEVLEMSGKSASAGLGETQVIADLVTSAMNAYGKENLSAAQATDILVSAVKEGKAEADAMASSMGQILPIASELGVSFDQVAATQAAMTKTGTNASESATQLKSILSGMLKPSKQAAEQLELMGTSASEMRRKIREDGLLSALMDLREMTNKYGEEAMARVYPNIRGLMGVFNLMGSSLEENIKLFSNVKNSTGMLETAFQEAAETVDFKFNAAISQIKATAISFFDVMKVMLVPILETFSEGLKIVTEKATAMSMPIKLMTAGFLAIAAIIPPLILGFGLFLTTISGVAGGISTLAGIISAIGAPIIIAVGAIGIISGAFLGLILTSTELRDAIKEKFGEIISKIQEAADFVSKNFDDIKKAFTDMVDALNTGDFTNFTATMLELIPEKSKNDFIDITTKAIMFYDKIILLRDGVIDIAKTIGETLSPVFGMLKDSISQIDLTLLSESFSIFRDSLEPLLPMLKEMAIVFGTSLAVGLGIVYAGLSVLLTIIPNIAGVIMGLVGIVTNSMGIIRGMFTLNFDLIEKSTLNLGKSIISTCKNAFSMVKNGVKTFINSIIKFFTNLYDVLVGHSIIPDMINSIVDWFRKLPGRVLSFISSMVTNVISKIIGFKNSLVSNIANAVDSAVSKFRGLLTKIVSAAKGLLQIGKNAANNLLNGIKSINFVKAGSNIISSVIKGIKSMFGSLKETMASAVQKIRDYLPFSPAKVGPLMDLDKLNFSGPIMTSLKKAKDEIQKDWLGDILLNDSSKAVGNESWRDNAGTNINGNFNFYGVQDTFTFMKEMRSTIRRYGGTVNNNAGI